MYRNDGQMADDIYVNIGVITGEFGQRITDGNSMRIQSSELRGNKSEYENIQKGTTGKFHREDKQTTDDIYNNDVMLWKTGKEITESNATGIQSFGLTGIDLMKIRSSRAAPVCLVLLCLLLLTALIVLSVIFNQERQVLISRNQNLTNERDQLLVKYDLQMSLGEEDLWIYYGSSLYLISFEKKNWTESRRYCRDKGADLIITDNTIEHLLAKYLPFTAWIGLTDSDDEGIWKWVDGTNVTSKSWASGEPNSYRGQEEDCAVTTSAGWFDYPCNCTFEYICELSLL